MIGKSPEVSNFNRLFLKLNRFIEPVVDIFQFFFINFRYIPQILLQPTIGENRQLLTDESVEFEK